MNIKAFFVDALGGALELGIGTADDVLRHVTPDVLASSLPRPLWARLLTVCLGAPRVDAKVIVEAVGVANLCEHVPSAIIWACIAEIGARSIGQTVATKPAVSGAKSIVPLTRPPPDVDVRASARATTSSSALGPSIPPVNEPLAGATETEQDDRPIQPSRGRTPTAQRFRQNGTGLGQSRRPQAQATPTPAPAPRANHRAATELPEIDALAVDDSQLVDWQTNEETTTHASDDFSDLGRKS